MNQAMRQVAVGHVVAAEVDPVFEVVPLDLHLGRDRLTGADRELERLPSRATTDEIAAGHDRHGELRLVAELDVAERAEILHDLAAADVGHRPHA